MSTFMLKNSALSTTPVSNIFIEKHMPKARGEFIKVYLLLLKYSVSGEIGVNSTILASALNLLESDIMNALNYWNDEGVLRLIPIDKMGNFNVEFVNLGEEQESSKVSLLEELNNSSVKDMLQEVEKLLARPLSPKEMSTYISWERDLNFSLEMILLLIQYCISKGKSDYRYFEKVALSWFDSNIKTIDDAQLYIKRHEEKWNKYRRILNYLGIKDADIMKPQEEMLNKWVNQYNFPVEIIEKACSICFERLNRADFKYIDGILNSWHKDNIKTLQDISEKDARRVNYKKTNNYNNNNKNSTFNNFDQRVYNFDELERKLLGWDKDD
ncbi:DnaD domain protein [Clostridium sp. MSJ-4]|uniref:DnaD domain protein n=1 Tax=Clostridium simiarum TaxID=2841506 RepID=A0ABS6F1F9_9CLOT|nr:MULTISPECIES: DnaD domain protein [Clostridium]MBU5592339.1 DnaD domain protein [Clostridium simiarum]